MTTPCPGQTWPDRRPDQPTHCGQPLPDGRTLCWDCTGRLARLLRDLADDLAELHTQLARQSRAGAQLNARAAERPLPIDLRASDVLDVLRTILVGWTRVTEPQHWPADTERALIAHLRMWPHWATHPAANELLDELRYHHAEVLACIDTPPEWRYLGPCGVPTGPDMDGPDCQGDVLAIGGKPPTCRECGATHDHGDRIALIAEAADATLVNAADAAMVLAGWGCPIKADTIRQWASRGRIIPHGHDRNGHPTYVLGDLRTMAADLGRRRPAARGAGDDERKRQSAPLGAAQLDTTSAR